MIKTLPDHLFDKTYCGPLPYTPDLKISNVEGNWVTGLFKGHLFQAKVFSEVSDYGINQGRISKLTISKTDVWVRLDLDYVLFNFDRGMDIDNPLGHELASIFDYVIS